MINQSISAAFPYRLAWETIDSVTADWVSTVYPLSCRKYPGYARGVQSKLKPWYIQAVYRRAAQSSNVENLPFDPWFSHVNLHFELVFPWKPCISGSPHVWLAEGKDFCMVFPWKGFPRAMFANRSTLLEFVEFTILLTLGGTPPQVKVRLVLIISYYTQKIVFLVGPQISQVEIKKCVQQNWNLENSLSGCILFIHGYYPRWLCLLQWFSDTQWNTRDAPLAELFYAPPTWSLLGHLVCPNDLSIIYTVKLLYIVFSDAMIDWKTAIINN